MRKKIEQKETVKTISINGIEVDLIRRPIQKGYVRINPKNGRLQARVNDRVSEQAVIDSVRANMGRIQGWLRDGQFLAEAQDYHDGAVVHLWGRPLTVTSHPGGRPGAAFRGSELVFTGDPEDRTRYANAAYRKVMEREARLQLTSLMKQTGLPCTGVTIRDTSTRWGSYNAANHHMNLSLRLAHKPIACLQSVILHELCHSHFRLHNRAFYWHLDLLHSKLGLSRQVCDEQLKDKRTTI